MWKFQQEFGQRQRAPLLGGLLPEPYSGETSTREVSGKPRPEPGTLGMTIEPRWRLEDFCHCTSAPSIAFHGHEPVPNLKGEACSTPHLVICGKLTNAKSTVMTPSFFADHLPWCVSEMGEPPSLCVINFHTYK